MSVGVLAPRKQVNTHDSSDTDASAAALHHTLGLAAAQAAAGNHGHPQIPDAAGWVTLRKTVDEGRTNTIVMADDADLQFAILAGRMYEVEFFFVTVGTGTFDDFAFRFAFPAAPSQIALNGYFTRRDTTGNAGVTAGGSTRITTQWPTTNANGASETTNGEIESIMGKLFLLTDKVSGAGTLKMQWCQNVAGAETATLKKGSFMRYRDLGTWG